MNSPSIIYTTRHDATPEAEISALAAVYKFVLAKHEEAPRQSRPNEAERRSSEIGAKSSLPRG